MKQILSFFFILFLLSGCQKKVALPPQHAIKVLGHGGLGNTSSLPMNSLESILACYYTGAQGNELDLQMSADGILVAFHSQELSENTNLRGMVNALTWAELSKGYYRENPYGNYALVSLRQVLTALYHNGMGKDYLLSFDCKLYNFETADFQQKFAQALVSLIREFNLEEQVIIENADPEFLQKVQELDTRLALFLYTESAEQGIRTCKEKDLQGLSISTRNIDAQEIKAAQDQNLEVAIWNTHTAKDNREAVEKNPDYIQTERITYLLNLLY